MNNLIAVVDDEEDITELVAHHLRNAGFTVKEYNDPVPFLRSLKKGLPALVVLDLMLPGTDGLEICKQLKREAATAEIPVIMLTAKADETDKVLGLELGADDYITKPFSPKELVARVKVVLRRYEERAKPDKAHKNAIVINKANFEVLLDGKPLELTTTEFKIVELLASKPGQVFTRDQMLDALWSEDKIVLDRTIDVHIRNLREKLGRSGKLIKNIRGMGYKLEK